MASRFFAPALTFGQTAGPPALIDPYRLLQQGLDSMLTDIARGVGQADGNSAGEQLAGPRINVAETDNEIRLTAELPGVTEKDVQVTLDGDLLVIAGEKKQEQEKDKGNLRIVERSFGRFRRALRLPFAPEPDRVQAQFKDGVLTVEVPKEAEQRKRTRQIPVSRGADDGGAAGRQPRVEQGPQGSETAGQDQQERERATAE
jgi:HSP20 family protein